MGLVVTRWQKYGNDRLYVSEEDANESLGYFDCKAGRLALNPIYAARSYEVIAVLRPFLGRGVPESLSGRTPQTPQPEESDLARDQPSEAVAERAAQLRPRGFQGLAARILGLRTEATPWEAGAKGERIVDKQLGRLKLDGWQVLSSIMKRSGADVDHLVIGPPGVFTINTKHHHGARISVGEHVVEVDGVQESYLPKSRHEANSAARILSGATGLEVRVTPVLAFVGADSIDTRGSLGDVLITRGELIDEDLRELHAVYSVQERDHIYNIARRADIWLA